MRYFRNHPFLPATVYFIVTVVLLTLPGNSFPKSHLFDIPYFDKWVHIGLFGLLCFLFSFPIRDFSISNSQKRNYFLLITLIGIGYGISMEFVQKYWIPNRSFELMDIVADCVGCLLALVFSLLRLHIHKQA
jgi:VanZ family protein